MQRAWEHLILVCLHSQASWREWKCISQKEIVLCLFSHSVYVLVCSSHHSFHSLSFCAEGVRKGIPRRLGQYVGVCRQLRKVNPQWNLSLFSFCETKTDSKLWGDYQPRWMYPLAFTQTETEGMNESVRLLLNCEASRELNGSKQTHSCGIGGLPRNLKCLHPADVTHPL